MTRRKFSPRQTAAIGGAVIAAAAVMLTLDFMGVLAGLFDRGPETRKVRAVFTDAQQLHAGDPVRVDGVNVGEVDDIELDRAGGKAVVTLEIEKDAVPLYADARADIRWRTVLGGAFAVRVERGTPSAGPLGDRTIPATRTSTQTELEDVLAFNRGEARAGLKALPGGLADALADPDAPATALRRLADVAPTATSGLEAVRGRRAGRDLPELVEHADATVRALDARDDAMTRLVSGTAATLGVTAARRAELAATFRRAPAALGTTNRTLRRLERTLDVADPLLAELRAPSAEVAPTVAKLRPTLVSADRLLDRARPLVRALRPTAATLGEAAKAARPWIDDLRPSLRRLDDKILPYTLEVDPDTKHRLSEMIGPALGHLGPSVAGQLDQNGHLIRFPATTGSSPLYSLPCQIYINNPDSKRLLACKSMQEALDMVFSYNPLGQIPGSADAPETRKRGRR